MKHALPFALLTLWAPVAFAFPPCPVIPVEIDPLESAPGGEGDPRFTVWFDMVGNPDILDASHDNGGDGPGTGNCRSGDSYLQPIGPNTSGASINGTPLYAPNHGYGILGLPDLRTAQAGTDLRYRLDFTLENKPLPALGDWVDVLQFDFRWNSETERQTLPSTLYRVRVRQNTPRTLPMVEIIEVRRDPGSEQDVGVESVVATIPMTSEKTFTPVSLRWRQIHRDPSYDGDRLDGKGAMPSLAVDDGVPDATMTLANPVDSTFEVIASGNTPVFSRPLPDQWADTISIGLLNYSIPSVPNEAPTPVVHIGDEILRIEE